MMGDGGWFLKDDVGLFVGQGLLMLCSTKS